MLKDILVIIEVFPFGLFRTDDLVANFYGICLEEKSILRPNQRPSPVFGEQ